MPVIKGFETRIKEMERRITCLEERIERSMQDVSNDQDQIRNIKSAIHTLRQQAYRRVGYDETQKIAQRLWATLNKSIPNAREVIRHGFIERADPKMTHRAGQIWSDEDDRALLNLYNLFVSVTARFLGRTKGAISCRVRDKVKDLHEQFLYDDEGCD